MSVRERLGLLTAGDWAALLLLLLSGVIIGIAVVAASR